MLVILALGDVKVLSFALGDAKVPDARYFAFWWNIGFRYLAKCQRFVSALYLAGAKQGHVPTSRLECKGRPQEVYHTDHLRGLGS